MQMRSNLLVASILAAATALGACDKKAPPTTSTSAPKPAEKKAVKEVVVVNPVQLNAYPALPARIDSPANPVTDAKVALGRMLFFETRLSKNHDVSCNSCHDLAKYGVDGEKTSLGHKKQRGTRNSPTVYNAAGQFAQFWDARAKDVEEQALGPLTNPVEMALKDEAQIAVVLKSIPGYAAPFKKAFPSDKDPITPQNAAKAIGAFERTLVTPSKWDKFVAGNVTALTDAEKSGFNTFAKVGCPTCHTGAYVGGTMLQKLGLAKPWTRNTDDTGRMAVTKQETDRMMFKVPSLRNVEKTAPYFHDGSVATLEEAIKLMGHHQLGKDLSKAEITSIATFLKALTGELPTKDIQKPELPPSGPKTPKADPT